MPTQYNERVPKEAFQSVGTGVIEIAPVMRAAVAAGAKHFFVEQDQTPGNPLDSLKLSAEYLKKFHSSTPYGVADTPAAQDLRIQNLGQRSDTVLN
jgi:hypothetical protein